MTAKKRRKTPVKSTRKRKKKIKGLDKYVIVSLLYIVAWSIAFFVAWIKFQSEPSILEGCILTPGVVELVACAFIKSGKEQKNADSPNFVSNMQYDGLSDNGSDQENVDGGAV